MKNWGDVLRYPFDKFKLGTGYGVAGSRWRCGWHSGQDFSSVAAGGDGLVYPLYRGEVARITSRSSYGNCVYVRHSDGYLTLYAHLKAIYVRVGMEVDEKFTGILLSPLDNTKAATRYWVAVYFCL